MLPDKRMFGGDRMKLLLPATVTTYEALCVAVKNKVSLIYIPYDFWFSDKDRIYQKLLKYRYRFAELPAGKGLFYIRGYRLRKYYILDPDHIY